VSSSKTQHQHSGSPAADEQALPGHGLELLQDGAHEAPDPRAQERPRRRRLPLPGLPHRGDAAYPCVCVCVLLALLKVGAKGYKL